MKTFKLSVLTNYTSLIKLLFITMVPGGCISAQCQVIVRDTLNNELPAFKVSKSLSPVPGVVKQYDVADLLKAILHPHRPAPLVVKNPSGITVIPNIASNPTIGFQVGIKAVAGKKLGRDPATLFRCGFFCLYHY